MSDSFCLREWVVRSSLIHILTFAALYHSLIWPAQPCVLLSSRRRQTRTRAVRASRHTTVENCNTDMLHYKTICNSILSAQYFLFLSFPGGDTVKKCKVARDQVVYDLSYSEEKLVKLLLHTSRFEDIIVDLYSKVRQAIFSLSDF